jgi:prepilin-type N-terminal cleavage/methylation domain-containing protein
MQPTHPQQNPRISDPSLHGSGFSLVETIVALALLSVSLLSISALFAQSSTVIKAGKERTEALAVATDILEEMNSMSYRAIYESLGAPASSSSFVADSRSSSYASRWQAGIEEAVWDSHATISLFPLGGSTTPSTFASCQGMRIIVSIHWHERGRAKALPLSTVKF